MIPPWKFNISPLKICWAPKGKKGDCLPISSFFRGELWNFRDIPNKYLLLEAVYRVFVIKGPPHPKGTPHHFPLWIIPLSSFEPSFEFPRYWNVWGMIDIDDPRYIKAPLGWQVKVTVRPVTMRFETCLLLQSGRVGKKLSFPLHLVHSRCPKSS